MLLVVALAGYSVGAWAAGAAFAPDARAQPECESGEITLIQQSQAIRALRQKSTGASSARARAREASITRMVCLREDPNGTQTRPITLIHIPRTGGTSMEDCTKEMPEGQRWGQFNAKLKARKRSREMPCYPQHVPPNLAPDLYEGQETFCVVRNPYTRAISQIGFMAGFFPKAYTCNASSLNAYLRQRLPILLKNPFIDDCHLLPQAAFVKGWDIDERTILRNASACGTVLRFESLAKDFNGLMKTRGLSHRLSVQTTDANTQSGAACRLLTVDDLDRDVRLLIEDAYRIDFELFGFQFLTQTPTNSMAPA